MPVRDAESTLGAALSSVLRQRRHDWECIVVDDGSQDGSAAQVRRLARRDRRFRLIARAAGGIVAALTTGLEACRAPLVARMDADDLMHRERLTAQLAALAADPHLDAVGCHVRVAPRDALTDGARRYEAWLNGIPDAATLARERFIECPLAHPTLAIRTELLRRFAYRDRGWPEDYDLILRLIEAGHRVGVVPRRLHTWRDSPGRLQRTHPAYATERFTACKAAHLAAGFLRDRPSFVLWGHGATGRSLRRALADHDRRPSHIVELHPGRLGNVIDGAPVVPPESLRELRPPAIVVSVAGLEARTQIRQWLRDAGFIELGDFVCAA